MKRPLFAALSLLLILLGSVGNGWADNRHGLPPEERREMRQQMREHWQQAPPRQHELRRDDEGRRWQQVPPEERRRMRDEMRDEMREQRRERRGWDERRW